ncbi:DUF202 domain-containing protein [Nocardioides faecalis]|uniref:DUF202 domain-containing protein n=1 Tax=Nocardioides faecalis TaxID=2803858 RepID=UPI0024B563BF|nr:DUF202 domain-containing protein [Nocardioides faecalis]
MANERTFLSWVRLALALVAGAVAVASPALGFTTPARLVLSVGLLLLAAIAVGVGWYRWEHNEVAIRTGAPRPGFTGGMLFLAAAGLLLTGALLTALLSH